MLDSVQKKQALFQQRTDNVRLLSAVHAHVACNAVQHDADWYGERIGCPVINEVRTQSRQIIEFNEIIIITCMRDVAECQTTHYTCNIE